MLKHEKSRLWTVARDSVQQCFPNFRNWEFDTEAYTSYFGKRKGRMKNWIGKNEVKVLHHVNSKNPTYITQALDYFAKQTARAIEDETIAKENDNHTISVPFLHSSILQHIDMYTDKYYDDLIPLMQFDDEKCCKMKPDPDETVFVSCCLLLWYIVHRKQLMLSFLTHLLFFNLL